MKKKDDMFYEDDRPFTLPYYLKNMTSEDRKIMLTNEEAIAAILFKYSPRRERTPPSRYALGF
jgi:hypothetical protein